MRHPHNGSAASQSLTLLKFDRKRHVLATPFAAISALTDSCSCGRTTSILSAAVLKAVVATCKASGRSCLASEVKLLWIFSKSANLPIASINSPFGRPASVVHWEVNSSYWPWHHVHNINSLHTKYRTPPPVPAPRLPNNTRKTPFTSLSCKLKI